MKNNFKQLGVSSAIFTSVVVVLVIVAGIGYGLYVTSNHLSMEPSMTMTTTQSMTQTVTATGMMNETLAYGFTAASGAMVSSAWLVVAPLGMNEYAVSVHVEGLEPNGTYILEGALASGNMSSVPISSESMTMNVTSASEFQSNNNGTGLYWIQLSSNPVTTFENVQLYFVPEMMMQNATLVATASFSMASETSSVSSSSM